MVLCSPFISEDEPVPTLKAMCSQVLNHHPHLQENIVWCPQSAGDTQGWRALSNLEALMGKEAEEDCVDF